MHAGTDVTWQALARAVQGAVGAQQGIVQLEVGLPLHQLSWPHTKGMPAQMRPVSRSIIQHRILLYDGPVRPGGHSQMHLQKGLHAQASERPFLQFSGGIRATEGSSGLCMYWRRLEAAGD